MKHALLTFLLLSGSAASAQTFGTIPDDLQKGLASRRPVLNGTDVSAALGTFRMDSPQLGCPMTVYGRFEDGALDMWSDADDAVPAHRRDGELHYRPLFHFMNEGQSFVFAKPRGIGQYEYYVRATVSRASSNAGALDLYQEMVPGMRKWNEVNEYGAKLPSPIQLSLEASGRLTLVRREYLWSKPQPCSYQKISAAPGPLAPRVFKYSFEARVLVGEKPGLMRGSFDMDEFADFNRDAALRGFTWTIALDDGRTIGEEIPLPDGDWRKTKPGSVSPGMVQPNIESPFFVELEADAYTRLDGRDQLLRLFMRCDEALASCEVIPSAVTGSAAGFFAAPFSNFAKRADATLSVEGGARIRLERR